MPDNTLTTAATLAQIDTEALVAEVQRRAEITAYTARARELVDFIESRPVGSLFVVVSEVASGGEDFRVTGQLANDVLGAIVHALDPVPEPVTAPQHPIFDAIDAVFEGFRQVINGRLPSPPVSPLENGADVGYDYTRPTS